ncbi:PaaI family thioesterase [Blastococcus sp. SYSU DS1024]
MSRLPVDPTAAAGAFVSAMRFDVGEASGTRVTGHVDLGPDQHTPWGVVHGGLYCSVVESAASIGASLAVRDRGQFAVGVNNNTDFLRSMTSGRVDVVAEPVQQGRTQQLWQVALTREDGELVARGQVRLQNVPLPGQPSATGSSTT